MVNRDCDGNIMWSDIKSFESKMWLASPTMHGEELEYVTEAYRTNSTVGAIEILGTYP